MKNLKKKDMRALYFEKMDVFWPNMGMRATCFMSNGQFFVKIWVREQWFFREKSWGKGILLTFWPIIHSIFDRIGVFLTYYGHDNRRFFMKKLKRMAWEHCVFERIDVFLTKYGHESNVFFEIKHFFNKIWAWEHCFSWKLREKWYPIDFFGS